MVLRIEQKRILWIFLIFMNIVPIVTGFIFINLFSVDVLYRDQFTNEVPIIIKYYNGNLVPSDFLSLNNDHRPIFVHILTFCLNKLSGVNNIVETNVGYLLHVLAFAILWILFKQLFPELKPLSFFMLPVSWFFFNIYLIAAYLWGILLSSSLCLVAAIAMVYFLERSSHYDWFLGASILAAVVGMFSWVAGIFLWPAGFIQIMLSRTERKIEKLVTWTSFAAGVLIINYVLLGFRTTGVHGYEGYTRYIDSFINFPFHKSFLIVESLGANIVHNILDAFVFGVIILSILIFILINERKHIFHPENAAWFAILAYSLLVHGALVITRSGEGDYFGPANNLYFLPAVRHFPSTFIFMIGLYGLVLSTYVWNVCHDDNKRAAPKEVMNNCNISRSCGYCILLGIVAMILFSGYILHIQSGVVYGTKWAEQNTQNRETILNYKNVNDSVLIKINANRDRLVKLDKYNLSVFGSSSPGLYPGWLPDDVRQRILHMQTL